MASQTSMPVAAADRNRRCSPAILTAGADTFFDRKNETSKCCDISFDLLMVKTGSEKQVKRWDHLYTLLGEGKEPKKWNGKHVSHGQNKGNHFSFAEKQQFLAGESSLK